MGKVTGIKKLALDFEVEVAKPLDTRCLVDTVTDLTNTSTFGEYSYDGMIVTVKDTGDVYVLIDNTDTGHISSWRKIGEGGGSSIEITGGDIEPNND